MATVQVERFFSNKQRIMIFLRKSFKKNNFIFAADIQTLLGIKKSYVSSLLSELEVEGLIARKEIGRQKGIQLTKPGFDITQEGFQLMLDDDEDLLLKSFKLN